MPDAVRYGIGELADLAGVSRRTVRYYVQEGLLPSPLGVGRGNHYGAEHLEQLLKVRAMQEAGRTLDEIKAGVGSRDREGALDRGAFGGVTPPVLERSMWRRLTIAPGVELHVAGHVPLPSASRLADLAAWCREHFNLTLGEEENTNA